MKINSMITQVWRGKSIYRILMNWGIEAASKGLSGKALDLASGSNPSYLPYLPPDLNFLKTDIKSEGGADQYVDFNKTLPFANGSFDCVFFVNALYIVRDRKRLFDEVKRVLAPGGKFIIVSPFISNEMMEPDDLCRLTFQGLSEELESAGFDNQEIKRFGERFSSAVYLLDPFWYFRIVKLVVYALAMLLDRFIPARVKLNHPTPLGYIAVSSKP